MVSFYKFTIQNTVLHNWIQVAWTCFGTGVPGFWMWIFFRRQSQVRVKYNWVTFVVD